MCGFFPCALVSLQPETCNIGLDPVTSLTIALTQHLDLAPGCHMVTPQCSSDGLNAEGKYYCTVVYVTN